MRTFNLSNLFSVLGCSLLMAAGCGESAEIKTFSVDHYKAPCHGVGPSLCMQVREEGEAKYGVFYGGIGGFTPVWGHRYEIKVAVTEVDDPQADASSLEYDLVELISDEVISEPFELVLSEDFVSGDPSTGGFRLGGERDVTCADTSVCETVATALETRHFANVELEHPQAPTEPLIARTAQVGVAFPE